MAFKLYHCRCHLQALPSSEISQLSSLETMLRTHQNEEESDVGNFHARSKEALEVLARFEAEYKKSITNTQTQKIRPENQIPKPKKWNQKKKKKINEPSWPGWLILLLIVWNKLGFVEFLGFWVFECLRFLGFLWFNDFGYESLGKNEKNWWIFSIGLCSLLKFYCIIDLILSGKGSWFNGINFEFVF